MNGPEHAGPLKVAVVGAGGQLGRDLVRVLQADERFEVAAYDHSALDVTDAAACAGTLAQGNWSAVVNCAALTNVDACEENPERAYAVNALGAWNVASACAAAGRSAGARSGEGGPTGSGAPLCIYISTDFVFAGGRDEPYAESDAPEPINVYGASKLAGEQLTRIAAPEDSLLVRVSSLFGRAGSRGKGGNFVEAILAKARAGEPLKVIDDITMSPTWTVDAARALAGLIAARATGTVHLSNSGSCTWFDFARCILAGANLDVPLERVGSAAFPRPARRPRNSALTTERLEGLIGRRMPDWQDALKGYLEETE